MKEHFLHKGWVVIDLPDPAAVFQTREFLVKALCKQLGTSCSLETYHLYVEEDKFHTELQIEMTRLYREHKSGPQIIFQQLPFFCEWLGPDLFVQANPYLRIARPNKPQDNIGYHRDTFYGGSPYELSIFIPFVDLAPESSLRVLSGSHTAPEGTYSTCQTIDQNIKKGSAKHQLGFLYAPKLMKDCIEEQMTPICLKVGQALIFSLSTVHGSRVNKGLISRWSSDIRVMHAMAPVDLSARPTYYQQLNESVVTQAAKHYLYGKEKTEHVELGLCNAASGRKS